MEHITFITWKTSGIARDILHFRDGSIPLVEGRSFLINSLVARAKTKWVCIHSPTVKVNLESDYFATVTRRYKTDVILSVGKDWKKDRILLDTINFAVIIKKKRYLPLDTNRSDTEALKYWLDVLIRPVQYCQCFRSTWLKRSFWTLK